jgi:hypothetical protein
VRISSNPMPFLRAAAVVKVNEQFNCQATQNIHRDAAHSHKRTVAAAVLAGAEPTAEFIAEATLRDVSAAALAADIASRPNLAAARELERQRLLLAIEAATTPDQLPIR